MGLSGLHVGSDLTMHGSQDDLEGCVFLGWFHLHFLSVGGCSLG